MHQAKCVSAIQDLVDITRSYQNEISNKLDSMVKDLRRDLGRETVDKNPSEFSEFSKKLQTYIESARDSTTVSSILETLYFTQMSERQVSIPKAHSDTLEWIFSSESNFEKWLQRENGIFWIAGKAGSGKSTLMKFIHRHEITRSALVRWAAGNRLITASHFFGVQEQRCKSLKMDYSVHYCIKS